MCADIVVRARIDIETKRRAAEALAAMGLSMSDAIRLLMIRIANEQRLPFAVKRPNKVTEKAINELEAGHGESFNSPNDLFDDLKIE